MGSCLKLEQCQVQVLTFYLAEWPLVARPRCLSSESLAVGGNQHLFSSSGFRSLNYASINDLTSFS